MISEKEIKSIKNCLHTIGENFEVVQILVCRNSEGNTENFSIGIGNWYARKGLIHAWLEAEQANTLATEIKN